MIKEKSSIPDDIKAVSTLGAQSTTVCALVEGQCAWLSVKVKELLASSWVSPLDKLAISLQFENGLRISEVLAISGRDINQHGQILVHGLKGSNSRIVAVSSMRDYVLTFRGLNCLLFEGYSRYYYHRLYKALGIYSQLSGGKKNAVTHLFRHLYLEQIVTDFKDLEVAQHTIGHKSISSTEHYAYKKKIKY